VNQNRQQTLPEEGRAKAARPSSRCLCPRPPLGSFTKEMRRIDRKIQAAPPGEALRPGWMAGGRGADFFGASSVASALGIRRGRDPAGDNGERGRAPRLEANLQPRPPLRMRRPRPPQVRKRGLPSENSSALGSDFSTAAAKPRHRSLGCPRLGCDPSQIDFRLRQGEKDSRVWLLS
jgi:hypothetical protein